MHIVEISPSLLQHLGVSDCWALVPTDLERLAVALLGARAGGWVRQGQDVGVIAKRHLAADARTLPQELATLSVCAQRIRTDGQPAAGLRAAAFYHLRFENIHALHDGNGRIGRLLLGAQCEQATRVPAGEILASLHSFENEYKWVFVPDEQAQRFELLVDLLAQITGSAPPAETAVPPYPLTPLHPLKPPARGPVPVARPKVPARPQGNFWEGEARGQGDVR